MANNTNKATASAPTAPTAVTAVPAPVVLVIPTKAPRTTAVAGPMLNKSTVAGPVRAAWALFGTLASAPGGTTRKAAVAAAIAAGIATYTARTQYQLFAVALRAANTTVTYPLYGTLGYNKQ